MRGYMTMSQAFECGDNDIPFIEDGYNKAGYSKKQLMENPNALRPTIFDHFSDKWQVKTAGQKVLEVAGIVAKVADDIYNRDDKWSGVHAVEVGNLCHQNGRLERDLELRSFVDAFKKFSEIHRINQNIFRASEYKVIKAAINAFENLKPLKAE